jgi:hypothetical protein
MKVSRVDFGAHRRASANESEQAVEDVGAAHLQILHEFPDLARDPQHRRHIAMRKSSIHRSMLGGHGPGMG